jgi:hypothetical protein
MNLATQLAKYQGRGYTSRQAEVIVLIAQAAITVFGDFPESFVLFGGASLVLFHDSVRHSADLDLLARREQLPPAGQVIESLRRGLQPIAEALGAAPLEFIPDVAGGPEIGIGVNSGTGRRLFRVDLSRYGPLIESEVEDYAIDTGAEVVPKIRSASRQLLLLQKAEAFLLRRAVKMRDAFDIHLLTSAGTELNQILAGHLSDTLIRQEIESAEIRSRIGAVDRTRCRSELRTLLPADTYGSLDKEGFRPLRTSLKRLYRHWL